MAQRVAAGLEEASAEMAVHSRAHPAFKPIGAGMAREWAAGIKLLSYFDVPPKRALSALSAP
jgi:hypothetical protein